jgi:hypothetical protein
VCPIWDIFEYRDRNFLKLMQRNKTTPNYCFVHTSIVSMYRLYAQSCHAYILAGKTRVQKYFWNAPTKSKTKRCVPLRCEYDDMLTKLRRRNRRHTSYSRAARRASLAFRKRGMSFSSSFSAKCHKFAFSCHLQVLA